MGRMDSGIIMPRGCGRFFCYIENVLETERCMVVTDFSLRVNQSLALNSNICELNGKINGFDLNEIGIWCMRVICFVQ